MPRTGHRIITTDELRDLRAIIAAARWKSASSPQYRNAPHSYIIKHSSGPEWQRFADLIKHCGTIRQWRGHRYRYLILDGKCYWMDWPALNRADASTLDPVSRGRA